MAIVYKILNGPSFKCQYETVMHVSFKSYSIYIYPYLNYRQCEI